MNTPHVADAVAGLTRTSLTIFYAHRFTSPEAGLVGYSPETLREVLACLRKQRFDLISLEQAFQRLREGAPLNRAVVFTMDDGYFDQGRVAGRIFAEFDAPATIFPVTAFLDGELWLWWDQVAYIFRECRKGSVVSRLCGRDTRYSLGTAEERASSAGDLVYRCERVPDAERIACIEDLRLEADVDLPRVPPPDCAPLTWEEARELEKVGVTFGPHTVTHPVLSQTTDEKAEDEIARCWQELQTRLARPVPVFCYPHGQPEHYGDRECAIVARQGLWGGVSGHFDHFSPLSYRDQPAICRVPRSSLPDNLLGVLQWVSGIEAVKIQIRRRLTNANAYSTT